MQHCGCIRIISGSGHLCSRQRNERYANNGKPDAQSSLSVLKRRRKPLECIRSILNDHIETQSNSSTNSVLRNTCIVDSDKDCQNWSEAPPDKRKSQKSNGSQKSRSEMEDAYIPVYVMMPLDSVAYMNDSECTKNRTTMRGSLIAIKAGT